MKNSKFLGVIFPLMLILLVVFIFAAANAPTVVIFEQNTTTNFDEGAFTINWTAGGGDTEGNYTVYLWMNGSFVNQTLNANNSATGYTWSNTTEANYTFAISAMNWSNDESTNATNVSIYVDNSVPTASFNGYTNVTYKKNTDQLILNISVSDAISGFTNSGCTFDINGTNETVMVSGGWCNTTSLNLTGLADGNQTIKVYINDTVNNMGNNLSFFSVQIDTTAPTITHSCTPATDIFVNDNVTCTCTATDAGDANPTISYTQYPLTSVTATNTTTCTVTDAALNEATDTVTYIVGNLRSTGGDTPEPSEWASTFVLTDTLFEEGYSKEMKSKTRMRVSVNNKNHHIGIKELSSDKVTIEIASDPVEILLGVGEDAKIDVTEDNFYDLYILLNSIENNKANLTVQKINEEILGEENKTVDTSGTLLGQNNDLTSSEKSSSWIWWIIIILIIIILYWQRKKIKKVF